MFFRSTPKTYSQADRDAMIALACIPTKSTNKVDDVRLVRAIESRSAARKPKKFRLTTLS